MPADRLAHGYRWEDATLERGAAAARRSVRVDGRHADLGRRPQPVRRRLPLGVAAAGRSRNRPDPPSLGCARCSRYGAPPPASVTRRTIDAPVALNAGGYGYGLRVAQTCDYGQSVSPRRRPARLRFAHALAARLRCRHRRPRQSDLHRLGRGGRAGARSAEADRGPEAARTAAGPCSRRDARRRVAAHRRLGRPARLAHRGRQPVPRSVSRPAPPRPRGTAGPTRCVPAGRARSTSRTRFAASGR